MSDGRSLGSEPQSYRTVVVGTDGSDTSMRAVERAAAIAARNNAKLIVANAHLAADREGWGIAPSRSRGIDYGAANVLKEETYKLHGDAPVFAMLREARDRAKAAGANDIGERAVVGAPVKALVDLVEEVEADLLVVGSVGLNTFTGRLLGSMAAGVSRRAKTDVLIVHTT